MNVIDWVEVPKYENTIMYIVGENKAMNEKLFFTVMQW